MQILQVDNEVDDNDMIIIYRLVIKFINVYNNNIKYILNQFSNKKIFKKIVKKIKK